MGLIREFWGFIRTSKKFWLLPIIVALLLTTAFIIFTESSAIAPFIYAVF